jgi:hypothetical protein
MGVGKANLFREGRNETLLYTLGTSGGFLSRKRGWDQTRSATERCRTFNGKDSTVFHWSASLGAKMPRTIRLGCPCLRSLKEIDDHDQPSKPCHHSVYTPNKGVPCRQLEGDNHGCYDTGPRLSLGPSTKPVCHVHEISQQCT